MFVLPGRCALSPFRLERLNREVQSVAPGVAVVKAHWLYLIEPEADTQPDRARLAQILQADGEQPAAPASLYVVPRLGTISPWSSKATEILRGCGLPVARVERGMALWATGLAQVSEQAARAAMTRLH